MFFLAILLFGGKIVEQYTIYKYTIEFALIILLVDSKVFWLK